MPYSTVPARPLGGPSSSCTYRVAHSQRDPRHLDVDERRQQGKGAVVLQSQGKKLGCREWENCGVVFGACSLSHVRKCHISLGLGSFSTLATGSRR